MGEPSHLKSGRQGERLAETFLKRAGFKTIARRFSTPVGELDLVMRDGDTLVFVEVKTRADDRYADPQDAVDAGKQGRLLRAARWYINQKRCDDQPCRFDVVTVITAAMSQPQIQHFPDAFVPDRW